MTALERQIVLLDMLNYVSDGNFAVFDKLARKAWMLEDQNYESRMLVHNQLQACQMSGLIDTIETETSLRWSANADDAGIVRSNFPKEIYRGNEFSTDLEPLIVDAENKPLIIGKSIQYNEKNVSGFPFEHDLFFSYLPDLNQITNEVTSEEIWPRDPNILIEVFDVEKCLWTEQTFEALNQPALIRKKGEFSGRTYMIAFPDLSLVFLISSPEWIFLISIKLLKLSPNKIFKQYEDNLKINSRIKLPSLIKRFFFANSRLVKCGAELEFCNLCSKSKDRFFKFLGDKEYL